MILLLPLVIILLDQITKVLAGKYLFILCNEGIGLGINISGGFAIIVVLFVLVIVLYLAFREKDFFSKFSYVLIVSGGISNLIDRLQIGCVRDFVNLGIIPAFNLADFFITMGFVILAYKLFRPIIKKYKL